MWKIIELAAIGSLFLVYFISFFACRMSSTNGKFPDDKKLLNELIASTIELHDNDVDLKIIGSDTRIRNIWAPVCKWKINLIGYIPRWYKSHRYLMKQYRMKRKNEEEKGYIRVFRNK